MSDTLEADAPTAAADPSADTPSQETSDAATAAPADPSPDTDPSADTPSPEASDAATAAPADPSPDTGTAADAPADTPSPGTSDTAPAAPADPAPDTAQVADPAPDGGAATDPSRPDAGGPGDNGDTAAPTMPQEHLDWTSQFCGMDVNQPAAAAPADDDKTGGGPGPKPDDTPAAADDGKTTAADTGAPATATANPERGPSDGTAAPADNTDQADGASGVWDKAKAMGGKLADGAGAAWDGAKQTGADAVQTVKDAAGAVENKAKSTVDAVKDWVTDGKSSAQAMPPLAKGDVGAPQQARADEQLSKMSADDQQKVQDALNMATPEARNYLIKALAGNHSADEIAEFAGKIDGQDPKWMDEQLHLVGQADGKGIKQQWHDSCGPTTVEAMKGEMDPIYALKMHEDNKDITSANDKDGMAENPSLAADQQNDLVNNNGVAAPRDTNGKPIGIDKLLAAQSGQTGVTFDCQGVRTDPDALNKGLNQAEVALKSGMPVPVRVGDNKDGHFVLMTGVDDGPPRNYSFHDPWQGKSVSFTEDQIKNKQMSIGFAKQITHIWQPSMSKGS